MYVGVGLVFATIVVLLSPAIWLAWWMVAELGTKAGGTQRPRPV